jgi:hypothetical protein
MKRDRGIPLLLFWQELVVRDFGVVFFQITVFDRADWCMQTSRDCPRADAGNAHGSACTN